MTHTPGPWHASESGLATNEGQIAVLADEDRIALVDLPEAINIKRGERWRAESPTRAANARLIAAAPEMLAALKSVRARFQDYRLGLDAASVLDRVNEVISKAEST